MLIQNAKMRRDEALELLRVPVGRVGQGRGGSQWRLGSGKSFRQYGSELAASELKQSGLVV